MINVPKEDCSRLKFVFNSNYSYILDSLPSYDRQKLEIFDRDSVKLLKNEDKKIFDWLDIYQRGGLKTVHIFTKVNNNKMNRYKDGDIAFCFVQYGDKDWLLVDAFTVIEGDKSPVIVNEKSMSDYAPLFGRLVVSYENKKGIQITRRYNEELCERLKVKTILEFPYDKMQDDFPGYENVNLSWDELNRVIQLKTWQTVLKNQKGVYLITDTLTNKRYVGSATSDKGMILSRWKIYAENGHGGNKYLVKLVKKETLDYVKRNFRYSILDHFNANTDDKVVLSRESWWKEILLTRYKDYPDFGYNDN